MKKRFVLMMILVLAVLLPFALAEAAASPSIPAGAVTYKGHSYYIYTKKLPWEAAEKACEKVGGHLVTISSAGENKVVWELSKKSEIVWIGLTDTNGDQYYDWITGEPISYTNWALPEYDNYVWDGQYGFLSYHATVDGEDAYGVWGEGYSSDQRAYVCEWDTLPSKVTAPKTVKADQPASNTVRLTWTKGENARKYAIWRKDGSGSDYEKIGETKQLTFKDRKVKNGKSYQYKIQAINGTKSAYSAAVKAYPLSKPTGLKAKFTEKTDVVLSWKKVDGAKYYYVYHKRPHASDYTRLKTKVYGTKVTIPIKQILPIPCSGKYRFYVVPARGSFEGQKSSAAWDTFKSPIVYRAVLVGQHKSGGVWYDDEPGCEKDCYSMTRMLQHLSATNYEIHKVINGSKSDILNAIDLVFSHADRDDVTLFFYSGHGSEGGIFHPGEATGALVCNGGGVINPDELRKKCDQYKGKKVMIFNSCHSGNMIGKAAGSANDSRIAKMINSSIIRAFASSQAKGNGDLAGEGYYVITSCTKNQTSAVLPYGGFFTAYLSKGLGWDVWRNSSCILEADTNQDNMVSFKELCASIPAALTDGEGDTQNVQYYPANCSEIFFGR